jgi:F-type H+-transporting ATPase subunit a
MHNELWFTALLNKLLAGVVSPLLAVIGVAPHDPAHPIPDYIAMEILVMLVIVAGVLILRRQLSVENPGKFQHVMEVAVEFVRDLAREIIGHGSERYVAMLGTLGLTIVICNMLGLIPTLATPTGHIQSTLGFAVAAFLYYNYQGLRHHGPVGFVRSFCGPMLILAPLMLPVEVISNVFRLLSLSVRLYANMFVGELLEHVFGSLVPIGVPALVMGLHVFVSFIQAYIFVLLPAVYLSMAVAEEH